jgi:hypothetical protein
MRCALSIAKSSLSSLSSLASSGVDVGLSSGDGIGGGGEVLPFVADAAQPGIGHGVATRKIRGGGGQGLVLHRRLWRH